MSNEQTQASSQVVKWCRQCYRWWYYDDITEGFAACYLEIRPDMSVVPLSTQDCPSCSFRNQGEYPY